MTAESPALPPPETGRIRDAIFRISQAAMSAKDLASLYSEIHRIVGQLMPAQNFYIAMYDPDTRLLSFPYFVDEAEEPPTPYKAGRGLTEYVLRTGKPFYASTEGYERLVKAGEVVRIGPMSIDWVGVPLVVRGKTIGVLVLQAYREGVRYGEAERDVLTFVSEQIAMAIERKREEVSLRDSEERYRLMFESNPLPMWVYDLENLRFLAVNDAAVQHYGYSRSEFLEMTITDIRPPEDVPALLDNIAHIEEGVGRAGIWRHRKKDGTPIDVEITSHALTFSGRRAELVLANDVTERMRPQEALEAAEAKFRSLVEQSLVGIYIIQGDHFAYVNPKLAQIFGYEPKELVSSKRVLDLVSPENRSLVAENIRKRLEGNVEGIQYSFVGLRADGSRIDVEVHGNKMEYNGKPAIIGSLLDITERKRAEDALRKSEARFRTLFEAAADAIVLADAQGNILDVNPATEVLVGQKRPDLQGKNLQRFLYPEDVDRATEYLRSCLDGRPVVEPFDVAIRTSSGARRLLAVRSQVVREKNARPYVEMIIRDVTDQREMQRRLMESERLASMGQMAAYIAHEINTPLANISLLAASIQRRETDQEILDKLEKINVQRRHAASIIADLLGFSKQRQIEVARADLRGVILAALDQVEPYRRPGVHLVVDLGEDPAPATIDPIQMQGVFVNLLKNALEATTSGSVTIRIRGQGRAHVIDVSDTGPGIPVDVLPRLFQPFFTTKRNAGGTGLGLALSQNVVNAHGGDIHVSSVVGKGSTFSVVLPSGDMG